MRAHWLTARELDAGIRRLTAVVREGGTAGGFLRYVADAIEHPGSVLADM
jgi:hypothetical protein